MALKLCLIFIYTTLFKNVCAEDQNPDVKQAAVLLMAPVPLALSLISSLALYFYPINEKVACENTDKIAKLKEYLHLTHFS